MADARSVVEFVVNGRQRSLTLDPKRSLLDVLRNDLGLKASHFGCGSGECGACMVLLDEHAVPAVRHPGRVGPGPVHTKAGARTAL